MRSRTAHLLVIAALLATVLTGCGGAEEATVSSEPGTMGAAPQVAPDVAGGSDGRMGTDGGAGAADMAMESQAKEAGAVTDSERMIVRNGSIELRVKDVDQTVTRLRAAVKASGGEIADLSISGGVGGEIPVDASTASEGSTEAYVTIRVPADRLDALVASVAKLGDVVSQAESANDVTEQAIDTEARLKNLRAEEDRLRSFLDRAAKVSDLLAIEAELSRVRGEIEAMDAQLTYLKRQVAKATLTVTLREPVSVVGPESPWYGLREAFSRGVQAAIVVVQVLITVAIAALPLLLLVGLVVWIVVALVRHQSRKSAARAAKSARESESESAGEEPVE